MTGPRRRPQKSSGRRQHGGSDSGSPVRQPVSADSVWSQTPEEASPRGISDGRALAYVVLREYHRTGRFIQDLFGELEHSHTLSKADRALALDIASTVIRRLRTIDVVIESRLSRSRDSIENDLWTVLRIGACQLLFTRAPDHAAVDSTVELCRTLGRPRWTGFVNGILRSIGRLRTSETTASPGSDTIPCADGQWIRLTDHVFADPRTDLMSFVTHAFSIPPFLAARWCRAFLSGDKSRGVNDDDMKTLLSVCFHTIRPPVTTLRVNRLRACVADVLEAMTSAGIRAERGRHELSLRLENSAGMESLPGYQEGWWSVQDEAAMAASVMLAPMAGERILDLCAAPGGKTTHLAELSDDHACIVACDVSNDRLQRVGANAARLRLTSIRTLRINRDGTGTPEDMFDAVLVDAPCSNSGVLNRRPEARWRIDESSIAELTTLQTRLLKTACERTIPGGRIVYSTCSLEPEENRGVVDRVCADLPMFSIEAEQLQLPDAFADGAYRTRLRRQR